MSDTPEKSASPPNRTRLSDAGRERVAERQARQAEALRANLRRRKEQLRARADQDGAEHDGEEPASTGSGEL